MKIIVATHNEGKLAEIRRILEERLGADAADIELVSAGSLGLPDPVEDGVTFQENALIKARDVAERTGCPAVADDSGLIVDVMGNAPGILSARWAGEHGNDKANNALLLKQLADIPDSKRTARFRCAAALVVQGGPARLKSGEAGLTRALALALHAMGEKFESLIDVTIVYPHGRPTFWQFMCGRVPEIVMRVHRRPIPPAFCHGDYSADAAFRAQIHGWLADLWAEKDAEIERLLAERRDPA